MREQLAADTCSPVSECPLICDRDPVLAGRKLEINTEGHVDVIEANISLHLWVLLVLDPHRVAVLDQRFVDAQQVIWDVDADTCS